MLKGYDTDYIESHIVRITVMYGSGKGHFDIKMNSRMNTGSEILQTAIYAFARLLNTYQEKGVWEEVVADKYLFFEKNENFICRTYITAEHMNNNCNCNYIEEDKTFEIILGNEAHIIVDRITEDVLDHIVAVEIIGYTETPVESEE